MEFKVEHSQYGTIIYNESFWTGKKSIRINSVELSMIGKNEFQYYIENELIQVTLQGNSLSGVAITIKGEKIQLVSKLGLFEILILIFAFFLPLIWGSTPVLCETLPLIGGAIGGVLYICSSMVGIILIKKAKTNLHKF